MASFRDQDLQKALGDVAQDAREESHELSLVLDANALKDELQGLSGIIQAQRGVLMRFENSIRNSADESDMESTGINLLKAASDKLRLFEAEFESLRADAEAIERDLLHLLDLRQKRANLREAHAASIQAQETSAQTKLSLSLSESAAWQSNVVMIFTILTSIYLPLSFFSSYYGMNLSDITGDTANSLTVGDYWKIAGESLA